MMLSGELQIFQFRLISLSLDHWLLFLDAQLCGVLLSEFPPRQLSSFEMETRSSIVECRVRGLYL